MAVRKTTKPTGEKEKKKKPVKRKTDKAYTFTKTGHKLTIKEQKFIDKYIETGNGRQSVIDAGYTTKAPSQYSQSLLIKSYIAEEIKARQEEIHRGKIASAQEVMEYFTAVMKGEIKDQFGLEAPLSERTKAAQELAKRTVDIDNRLAGKADANVTISIDWKRDKEENS